MVLPSVPVLFLCGVCFWWHLGPVVQMPNLVVLWTETDHGTPMQNYLLNHWGWSQFFVYLNAPPVAHWACPLWEVLGIHTAPLLTGGPDLESGLVGTSHGLLLVASSCRPECLQRRSPNFGSTVDTGYITGLGVGQHRCHRCVERTWGAVAALVAIITVLLLLLRLVGTSDGLLLLLFEGVLMRVHMIWQGVYTVETYWPQLIVNHIPWFERFHLRPLQNYLL